MTDAPQVDPEVDDVDEQHAVRLGKREHMLAAGMDPFPVALPITTTISEVRQAHPDLAPEAATGDIVGLAGRVVHMRVTGKLVFLSLQEGAGERLQAMVSFGEVGEESFDLLKELVDLGDHVFVSGEVIASKRGELSVMVSEWAIAAKALMPLPNLHSELNDKFRNLCWISTAHQSLKDQGIKFISTIMDKLLLEPPIEDLPHIPSLQNKISKDISWFPKNQTFLEWSRANGYPESDNWHPLEQAHEEAAKIWLPIYEKEISKHITTK